MFTGNNRVVGSALKAALPITCAKQVAAAGLIPQSVVVTFSGQVAYAIWEPANNGSGLAFRSFKINYPKLADDAVLTRVEADLVAAYTLHETGHVMFTQNDMCFVASHLGVSQGTLKKVHPLSNGLEDGRMEHSVIKQGIARNASVLFKRLLRKLCVDIGPTYNPCNYSDAAFTLALLAREAFGNGNEFTRHLLDRIPEPKRAVYQYAVNACANAPVGFDYTGWAYATAVEFDRLWNGVEKVKSGPAPAPQPQNPFDNDDNDGFGELDPDEIDEDEDEFVDNGSDKQHESDEGDEGDEGDDLNSTDGGMFNDTGSNALPPKSAEPSVDEIFKRANRRAESKVSALPPISPAECIDPISEILERIKSGFANDRPYVDYADVASGRI